ncbi:PglL family O-oligosaccharyltransferase [Enterobacter sp. 118C5]|uniref:PglL family O-oligosaccharyltransferase n=1 Tax=Enterobacter TaxID=547 RepID=UPI002A821DF4|nr:Wzy polymerase domain-containing protein [Enterobacter sp. 118C5]
MRTLSLLKTPSGLHSRLPFIRLLTFIPIALYWLLLLHIPWDNNGGYGLDLPMNLLCWGVISLLALIIWTFIVRSKVRYSSTFLLLLAGAILSTLPVIWSPGEGLPVAAPRLAGMWGGVLLYLTLLQQPLREKERIFLFYLLWVAAVIETAIALTGLFFPARLPWPLNDLALSYGGTAAGIFQQRNVTASFLATGLTTSLFLLGNWRRTAAHPAAANARTLALAASVIVMSATLVILSSRIGWLGGITGILITSLLYGQSSFRWRTSGKRRLLLVVLPLVGGLSGVEFLSQPVIETLRHEGSNHQRWLTLEYTLRMIMTHPWRGCGLGLFEPAYQSFMAALPFDNPNREMMQHPHNETLFIWAEGGIVALMGGLCLLAGWVVLLRRRKNLWQWAALLTTLPILLHTQVEFPLYYSVAHFFAVLLLLAAAESRTRTLRLPHALFRLPMAMAALYGIVFSFQLFSASISLGRFEAARLAEPQSITRLYVSWLMQMRYQRDLSLLHLAAFNKSRDIRELEAYARENAGWIALHMDENAWNDQVALLIYLHRPREAALIKARARRLMPWDARFN